MSAPRTLLVCGFGPFPGMPANPSGRLAQRLGRLRRPALADYALVVDLLPTTWAAVAQVPARIARLRPDAVLMLGVAGRRRRVCVERQAVNAAADAPDAQRRHPAGRTVLPGAPRLLRTRADGVRLRAALHRVPATLSRDAGRYLCNALYLHVLAAQAAAGDAAPAVFVHLPGRPRAGGAAYDQRMTAALGDLLVALAADARRARRPRSPTGGRA